MTRTILAIVLAVSSTLSTAQTPPVEFKGVPMGASRSELLQKMPQFECRATGCTIYDQDVIKHCGFPSSSECTRRAYGEIAFGPAFVYSWDVSLRDDRVANVRIDVPELWFSRTVIALTEKYGPPHSDATRKVQNRAGATYDNRTVKWTFDSGTITGEQRGATVDKSWFTMAGPGEEDRQRRELVDKAKASASKL